MVYLTFMVNMDNCYVNTKDRKQWIGFSGYVGVTELAGLIKQLPCLNQ